MNINHIYQGDCLEVLKTLPDESIDCVMTSPPYWALRDYGVKGQLGLEPTFQEYISRLCDIFDEVKRILKKEGTCWVNMGDTYAGGGGNSSKYTCGPNGIDKREKARPPLSITNKFSKWQSGTPDSIQRCHEFEKNFGDIRNKCLLQIPSRFAIEMCNRGWILRNEIIWHKPNCMPSSVKDRFTVDFEKIFFFTKSKKYYFKTQYEPAISEGRTNNSRTTHKEYQMHNIYTVTDKRNMRSVWRIATKPYKEAHFATYPEALCETPIKAGCPEFVCKKCGKAREKVYSKAEKTRDVEWHPEKYGIDDEGTKRLGRMQPSRSVYRTTKELGYTDCGCNAGWEGGIILDPFIGSGTTAVVAIKQNKKYIGVELNSKYIELAQKRINAVIVPLL